MQKYLSHEVDMKEVADRYAVEFGRVFNRNLIRIEEDTLASELRDYAEKIGEPEVSVHRQEEQPRYRRNGKTAN